MSDAFSLHRLGLRGADYRCDQYRQPELCCHTGADLVRLHFYRLRISFLFVPLFLALLAHIYAAESMQQWFFLTVSFALFGRPSLRDYKICTSSSICGELLFLSSIRWRSLYTLCFFSSCFISSNPNAPVGVMLRQLLQSLYTDTRY